jgi:hypothetical protein
MCLSPLSFIIKKEYFFIKNKNIKSCTSCSYFIEDKIFSYFELSKKRDGKCKLFYEKCSITSQINNVYASYCRADNKLCGKHAKYFKEKTELTIY